MSGSNLRTGRPRVVSNGWIAYPKRGWEPPQVPDGYRRKSQNLKSPDAWIFIPILKPCKHRALIISHTQCGACKISYQCKLFDEIKASQCKNCEEDHD